MAESARIAAQLKNAFAGNAWHGPALREVLADVDCATAAAHPVADAHSVWELALHVAAWEGVALRRLSGYPPSADDPENFPLVEDVSERAWGRALDGAERTHQELLAAVSALPDSRLSEKVPGQDFDFYYLLHGIVQHCLYHAGQMALLKKFKPESAKQKAG